MTGERLLWDEETPVCTISLLRDVIVIHKTKLLLYEYDIDLIYFTYVIYIYYHILGYTWDQILGIFNDVGNLENDPLYTSESDKERYLTLNSGKTFSTLKLHVTVSINVTNNLTASLNAC